MNSHIDKSSHDNNTVEANANRFTIVTNYKPIPSCIVNNTSGLWCWTWVIGTDSHYDHWFPKYSYKPFWLLLIEPHSYIFVLTVPCEISCVDVIIFWNRTPFYISLFSHGNSMVDVCGNGLPALDLSDTLSLHLLVQSFMIEEDFGLFCKFFIIQSILFNYSFMIVYANNNNFAIILDFTKYTLFWSVEKGGGRYGCVVHISRLMR